MWIEGDDSDAATGRATGSGMNVARNDRPVIPAATLVLYHEAGDSPAEHLMIERASGMVFAAGALAFPGGRIEQQDHDLAIRDDLIAGGGPSVEERAARIAAIRETIEETGVAIGFAAAPSIPALVAWRAALKAGGLFSDLLAADGHRVNLDTLVPFARWCPNLGEHRRFDTRFYIARAPHRAAVVVDADEASSHRWISARDAIAASEEGTARIIFPTMRNLERLAAHDRFEAAARHAVSIAPQTISPEIREEDGERWLCIPGDAGYPVTRALLSEVMAP